MASSKDTLLDRLTRYRQVEITVVGRNSGKKISRPVWFVLDGTKLDLLPVQGSDTQWYENLLKKPWIRLEARGTGAEFQAQLIEGAKEVASVVERFREKYGAADVKKYYSKFDVAVQVKLD